MRPIAEYPPLDRATFERDIVPKGEPAVFRGMMSDWPVVQAARHGDEELARLLHSAATQEPFEAWFGAPGLDGQFNYNADFSGFNFERRMATLEQLLDLLLNSNPQTRALAEWSSAGRWSHCRGSVGPHSVADPGSRSERYPAGRSCRRG